MKSMTNPESSASGVKKRRREEEVGCSEAANEDGAITEDQCLSLREF